MNPKNLHFCPSRSEYVSVKEGFEKCIKDHQCFDDEPCPLYDVFEAQAKIESISKSTDKKVKNLVNKSP